MQWVVFIVAAAVLLIGCNTQERATNAQQHRLAVGERLGRDFLSELVYLRDRRTGLCFAYYWGGLVGTFVTVPCEELASVKVIEGPTEGEGK